MTNPPYGNDEQGGADEPPGTGASRVDPDRYPTQPTPTVFPTPPPTYGQNPSYGQVPPYGQQPGPYGPPAYGPPPPQYGAPQYGPPPPQYGTPQYGTPQYGPPGQQFGPPQKSKVGLIALVTGILLVLIAAVVVLVMTLQSTVLDPAAVERDVAAQFQEREGVAIDLDCPDAMDVVEGATYECTGTTDDGESVTLRIAITDEDSAAYTWTEA
jgi:hypothetical protein